MAGRKKVALGGVIAVIISTTLIVGSCTHQPYVLPSSLQTNDPSICFERDILPIFQSNCAKSGCHDVNSHEEGYILDNYKDIVKRGIVPGNPSASRIWRAISSTSGEEDDRMPRNAPPLTASELDLIKRWITAGAADSGACNFTTCDTANFTYSGAIAPLMQAHCTGCHNSPSAPGGALADYTSVKNAAVNGKMIGCISHTPGYIGMPYNGAMLEDCEITQVKKWVAAGAPNN